MMLDKISIFREGVARKVEGHYFQGGEVARFTYKLNQNLKYLTTKKVY